MEQRAQTGIRQGVILAAGLGTRFDGDGKGSPIKSLMPVCDVALLLRTIGSLEVAGCLSVTIVLGWQAESVEEYIASRYDGPLELQFVFNERYHKKNGISVLCARPCTGGEFILTMADHVLDDAIMRAVRDHLPPAGGATLCVDYKLDTIIDMDDATKVLAEDGFVRAIGKDLKVYNCIDTGVFIGTTGLMDAISGIYTETGDASLTDGVQALARAGKMEAFDVKDAFWQDVDTPEMLVYAEELLRKHTPNLGAPFA